MGMQSFKDSLAWQKAMDLTEMIDIALAGSRNFGYKDQLFRASLSICNNLAEGYEMPTTPHKLRYLWIAKGSSNEVLSMLILAGRREYFDAEQHKKMLSLHDEVSRLIRTYIDGKSKSWTRFPGGKTMLFLWLLATTPFLVR
jgi:four helix bundle protein